MTAALQKPLLHIPPSTAPTLIPNLLPLRIHHSGPVNATPSYWSPIPLRAVEKGESERTDADEDTNMDDGRTEEERKEEEERMKRREEAYFRGRRLVGEGVDVPDGYTGLVLRESNIPSLQSLALESQQDDDDYDAGDGERKEEALEMEVVGGFEKVWVWGHEEVVEGGGAVGKALGEWMGWSGVVNGWEGEDDE